MMDFDKPINTRREMRTLVNHSKVQKLQPVMGMLLEPGEGGLISQRIDVELDPIPGRLLTPITAEVMCVFVPLQAVDALVDGTAYAGMTEVIRDKLVTGNALYIRETEGEITQRMGINPRSNAGDKGVSRYARFAHNAAVNFLRRRLHKDAVQLAQTNTQITPALLGSTVLTRLNGVLSPESRINGAVNLQLPTMQLPVEGIKQISNTNGTLASPAMTSTAAQIQVGATGAGGLTFERNAGNPAGTDLNIYAQLNGVTAGNVSLDDFYNAETMDRLTRKMGEIMEANPEMGQELVLRWAYGLSVDADQQPWLLAKQTKYINANIVSALDSAGVNGEVIRSDLATSFSFMVPVPKTELGGMVITFLQVKPDETIANQPHPVLGSNFGARNHAADSLKLDPVPVTMRELNSDIASGSEATVAMYIGNNELVRNYVSYGFGRNVNMANLTNKMAIWQLNIPLSVTPSSVLHPDTPDQSIFANTTADVVRYSCTHSAVIKTPIIFGPTPVEDLPVIDTNSLFGPGL